MFLNLIQQDIGFYDDHNSGRALGRLINDSGQLNAFAQFASQALLKALVQLWVDPRDVRLALAPRWSATVISHTHG